MPLSLRWCRRVLLVLLGLHVVAGVFAALPADLRSGFRPAEPYSSKLRLASNWDMFVEPRRGKVVEVHLVDAGGNRRVIASSDASSKALWARIVDARQRKLLSNLQKLEERASVLAVLQYHCSEVVTTDDGVATTAEAWAFDPRLGFEASFSSHKTRLLGKVVCSP
jgi:hypothetical protein